MPYIDQSRRKALSEYDNDPANAGELNYAITVLIQHYWVYSRQNYAAINDIVGALEGAKVEFQRRVVAPYEDRKIQENGDIYG